MYPCPLSLVSVTILNFSVSCWSVFTLPHPIKSEVLLVAQMSRINSFRRLSQVIADHKTELWRLRDQREVNGRARGKSRNRREKRALSVLPELSPLQIVVHLTEDLLSRASMTVVNGRPTLTINVSTAREHWLEGMLRHEIGMSMTSLLHAKGSTCMHSYLQHADGPDTGQIQKEGTPLSKEPVLEMC